MNLIFVLGFILVTAVTVFFIPRLMIWTIVIAFYLWIMHSYIVTLSPVCFYSIMIIFIITALFNIKLIRYIFTKVMYHYALSRSIHLSATEKLALEAGNSWYEKDILNGKPNFEELHNLQKFALTEDEQSFLNNETNTLCNMIDEWQIIHNDHDLPIAVWDFMRQKGFFGLVIKAEYGGRGFSAAAHSEIVMRIATKSISVAVTVMVPNSLGPGELLEHYGTLAQKQYYLPRLANGTEIPCFALTSPTAGSDATSIIDQGLVCYAEYNQQRVLGIRLTNVNKRYITLAPIATLIGLAFTLNDPDNLLNKGTKLGITCALIPYNHAGLEIGNRHLPLNQVFMNGTVRISDSFIPLEWVIGGQDMVGMGWKMLVECLSIGRAISLPACGTAHALLGIVSSSAYATIRHQFKTAIGNFEGIEEQLALMGGLTYMLNATRQFTVSALTNNIKPAVASAIAKYHITEHGRTVLNSAMDIHGGRGIMLGPNNYLATAYQSIPVGITVEGANIMTRNLLIYGQGIMQSHPYLHNIYTAITNNNFKQFDQSICGFMGFIAQSKVRAYWHALTAGYFAQGYTPSKFNRYYKQISRMSSALAFISNCTILFISQRLKQRERISARLGDAMSYLYMACATLKFFQDNNAQQHDEIFVQWVLQHCLYNTQEALIEVLNNFGIGPVGLIIQRILFLYGRAYKKPSDKLEHQLSHSLLTNSTTRQLFKNMCYAPNNEHDSFAKLDSAYLHWLSLTTIKQKIDKAITAHVLPRHATFMAAYKLQIITEEEFKQFNHATELINQVIQVDEFLPYQLGPKNAHPTWQ